LLTLLSYRATGANFALVLVKILGREYFFHLVDQVDEGDWGEASCFLHISDTCLEMLLPVLQMAIGQQFLVIVCALGEFELKRRKMNGLIAELETMDRPKSA